MKLQKVPQTEESAALVMRWRNDPLTRQMSFHQDPKQMPDFWHEFRDSYFVDPNLPPLFGIDADEQHIGFLRFRLYDDALPDAIPRACDISVMIAPEHRGKGYGQTLVRLGTDFIHQQGWQHVIAEIKLDNPASIHLFERCGYILLDQHPRHIHDLPRPVMVFRYLHTED